MLVLRTLTALILLLPLSLRSWAEEPSVDAAAAEAFSRGEGFYAEGKFKAAIEAFSEAQRVAPHAATLFNIARCHENLGNHSEAFSFYQQSLVLTEDAKKRADIESRIERLRGLPIRIFTITSPPGARVTVDARPQPEVKLTPTVLQLLPGEHLLLFRKQGYDLGVKRVVVEVGTEQTIELSLEQQGEKCLSAIGKSKRLSQVLYPKPLLPFEAIHLHLAFHGAFLFARGWPELAGPEIHFGASYRHLFFGGSINYFSVDRGQTMDYRAFDSFLFTGHTEVGWIFPFHNSFLYNTFAVGGYLDRITRNPVDPKSTDLTKGEEASGFSWSLSAIFQCLATPWLSAGVGLRTGMMHGDRIDASLVRKADSHHFPFIMLWGSLGLHL
jgi:hypothetical protein